MILPPFGCVPDQPTSHNIHSLSIRNDLTLPSPIKIYAHQPIDIDMSNPINNRDVSLIRSALLKAASSQNTSAANNQPRSTEFTAMVTDVQLAPVQSSDRNKSNTSESSGRFLITVTDGKNTLTLSSDQKLPLGLSLRLESIKTEPPLVIVKGVDSKAFVTPSSLSSSLMLTGISKSLPESSLANQLLITASRLQQMAMTQLDDSRLSATLPEPVKALLVSRVAMKMDHTAPIDKQFQAGQAQAGQAQARQAQAGQAQTTQTQTQLRNASLYAKQMNIGGGMNSFSNASSTAQISGNTRVLGASNYTVTTPDYAALLKAVTADLARPTPPTGNTTGQTSNTAKVSNNAPVLLQAVQSFIDRLPTASQLSTVAGVRHGIQHAPLNHESSILRNAAGTQQTSNTRSTDSINSVFKTLWGRLASSSQTFKETQVSQDLQASQPIRNSANIPQPTYSSGTQSSPEISLREAMQTLATQLSTHGTGSTHAEEKIQEANALLNILAAGTAPATAKNETGSLVTTDNLKGLVLLLMGRSNMGITSTAFGDDNLLGKGNPLVGSSAAENLAQTTARISAKTEAPGYTSANTFPIASSEAKTEGFRVETIRLLQNALAQTEAEQVRLIQTQDSSQYQIPLLWRDMGDLKQALLSLKRDEQNDTDGKPGIRQSRWQITLHFDLDQLGPLDIELDLCPPKVAAIFWSDKPATLHQLNTALQPLRDTLISIGAEVGELQARYGRKPPGAQPVVRHSLVDIHT